MAPPPSIPDEIAAFLTQYEEGLRLLPPVVNIAFSGERKPEAWHVKLINRQVSRGFNKSAPVTIMLSVKIWRQLLKKNKRQLWLDALQDGQIHIHGDDSGKQAVQQFFSLNGDAQNGKKPAKRKTSKSLPKSAASQNGAASQKSGKAGSDKTKKSKKKKDEPTATSNISGK